MRSQPARRRCARALARRGRSSTSRAGLGMTVLSGSIRSPRPAASSMPFTGSIISAPGGVTLEGEEHVLRGSRVGGAVGAPEVEVGAERRGVRVEGEIEGRGGGAPGDRAADAGGAQ